MNAQCEVCKETIRSTNERGVCPHCQSRPRVRSIPRLLYTFVMPYLSEGIYTKPLLGFSMTDYERRLLAAAFPRIKAVSLFGKFGGEDGIDARNLSRYPDGGFSAVYSSLLFDYFIEHEKALHEAHRVIAPGGVFMTHLAGLGQPDQPPTIISKITPKKDYYNYIPEGSSMDSVRVGAQWFLKAMRSAGFIATHYIATDRASGVETDWFVGMKPQMARSSNIPAWSKTYHIPLPEAFTTARHVRIELTQPLGHISGKAIRFSHHSGRTVIAGARGGFYISRDVGMTWNFTQLKGLEKAEVMNAHVLTNGHILLQCVGADGRHPNCEHTGALVLYGHGEQVAQCTNAGQGEWHGVSSIDEKDGVIIYADYQPNGLGREPRDSRVFRSMDGGRSWSEVFRQGPEQVRHFHIVRADPTLPKTWWLASGDTLHECRIWVSQDDGDNWRDMTSNSDFRVSNDFRLSRSVLRLTDLVFTEKGFIWGSDDLLGTQANMDPALALDRRAGSRLFYADRFGDELAPEVIGYCGQAVRNIVDCGEFYVILTQGQPLTFSTRPQVFAVTKTVPYRTFQLFDVDNTTGEVTGFSSSNASRAAFNGVFFSRRTSKDVFSGGNNLLMWKISFD